MGDFFWNEKAVTLEEQVLMPFQDLTDMKIGLEQVVSKVQEQSNYPVIFEKAFGSNKINPEKISKSLALFVRSIVSYSSKYDQGRAMTPSTGANFPNFTVKGNFGKNIFFQPIQNDDLMFCFFDPSRTNTCLMVKNNTHKSLIL